MNPYSVTLDSFTPYKTSKLELNHQSLTIYPKHSHDGTIIKNIQFNQHTNYIIHVNLSFNDNMSIYFYDTNDFNPKNKNYLINGKNKIPISIKSKSIFDIGILSKHYKKSNKFDILDIVIVNKNEDMKPTFLKDLFNNYFNPNHGFWEYKSIAVDLLKQTIKILHEFNINYFFIAGTLLGQVRHNDFIPWDDDIDLIVDATILDKIDEINKKYPTIIINQAAYSKWILKCHNKEPIIKLPDRCNWSWPFVDLFIYGHKDNILTFFNKEWDASKFFPKQQVVFNNIIVSIPQDPHYYLEKEYRENYMTIYKSNNYCHKKESHIDNTVTINAKLLKYHNI